jgi:hypothetical protein
VTEPAEVGSSDDLRGIRDDPVADPDLSAETEVAGDAGEDDPDGVVETGEPDETPLPDPETDEPDESTFDLGLPTETDPDSDPSFNFFHLTGTRDCLQYSLELDYRIFDFKADRIFVKYGVLNICMINQDYQVEHEFDFFSVGIQKDGEPWINLPDCPGIGDAYAYTFAPGEGIRRGWFWDPDDHESRLARCSVAYDPDASYTVVGYGLTEVDPFTPGDLSEIFVLTPPIRIELNE